LTENFEKEIEENYLKAKNFHSLAAFTDKLDVTLYSGDEAIVDKLQSILHEAQDKFADFMLSKKVDLISNAKSQIEEFVFEVREWQRELTDNPIDVDSIEEKMSKWRKIQKKYGQTANEVLMVLKDIEKEIDQLENFDQHQNIIEEKCIKLKFELTEIAEALHKERVKSALILIKKVNEELKDLNMKGVQFGIQINKMDHFNNRGNSDVEFTIQVSKEDKARSLNKIASGGELSRILLSLKRVTGSSELPRTYLFDEVDTGVSGETAEKVGSKLKAISKGQQVVCVTHLPQVAVFADNHFVISKIQKGKKVDMEIKRLERKEREEEIARLISGTKVTSSSIQHAKQLLNQVR
jgi:DNA repair protein RecN (Recombination protein N)